MAGLTEDLRAQGVEFLRFVWCDNANVLRARLVPIDHLRGVYQNGVGISYAQQAVPVVRDAFVAKSGLGPVGEARLVADWTSFLMLPYCPGHARVMGNMMVEREPWAHCPRHFLRRMVQKADSLGIKFQAAFENEFYLMEQGPDGPVPFDSTLFCATHGLNKSMPFLSQLIYDLNTQGCEVIQFHPESGGGQFELAIRHDEPMAACDQQITFRETVHATAFDHDLKATFLPKPFPDQAGSGCHIHISLWKDGKNITKVDSENDPTAGHFAAGLLKHLPALMALTTPIRNSYERLGRHLWSGGFSCWGYDNREAALRIPSEPVGSPNMEFKTHDASANPYLALGGIIAAGLDGVENEMELPDPIDKDPGLLSAGERKEKKIKELPTKLKTVLKSFEKSKLFKEALGEPLHLSYLSVKQEELDSMDKFSPDEEVKLLLERY